MRGATTRIQQVNDQVQVEVTIPNPVENSEELRKALNLTDDQRKKFAAAIKVEEEKVKQRIVDNARNQFAANKQTSARGAELRKAFFDEWNQEVLALLTPEQLGKLGNQRWRAKGIMSLLDPELGKQLELTERQLADIRKLLIDNRPPRWPSNRSSNRGRRRTTFSSGRRKSDSTDKSRPRSLWRTRTPRWRY